MDLTVTLDDGATLPLSACDWALLKPCGCATAITLAVVADGEVLASPQAAFASLEPLKRKRDMLTANGYTIKLMRRHEASALFLTKCTHAEAFRAVVTYTRENGSQYTNTYGPYATRNTARGVATLKTRYYRRWDTTKCEIKIQRATITWQDMP